MSYPPSPPSRNGPAIVVAALLGGAVLAALVIAAVLTLGRDDGSGGDEPGADRRQEAQVSPPAEPGPGAESDAAADPDADAEPDASGSPLPYVVLDPGECFDHPSLDSSVTSVEPRSCSGPHDGEVISNRTMTGDFDTARAFEARVLELCSQDAEKKLRTMPADGRNYFYYALFPTLMTYEYQSQDEISCALTLSTEMDGTKLTEPLP